jgi:hypothetical protein
MRPSEFCWLTLGPAVLVFLLWLLEKQAGVL